MIPQKNWYLVHCKPRQDERAEENLARQGYVCARPICTRERISRGKRHTVAESLFPGYLFIQMSDESSWAPLRSTRGVSRVVSFGGRPLAVGDELIARLQEQAGGHSVVNFQTGENVRIIEGSFSALDAIFMAMDGEERVVLLIDLLSRQQQVSLPLASVSAY